MPSDPTGTSPQPVISQAAAEIINIKCHRPECDSITAIPMQIPTEPGRRLYRCTKCSHTWGLNVGGFLDI